MVEGQIGDVDGNPNGNAGGEGDAGADGNGSGRPRGLPSYYGKTVSRRRVHVTQGEKCWSNIVSSPE